MAMLQKVVDGGPKNVFFLTPIDAPPPSLPLPSYQAQTMTGVVWALGNDFIFSPFLCFQLISVFIYFFRFHLCYVPRDGAKTAQAHTCHRCEHLLTGWIMDQDNNNTGQRPMTGTTGQGQGQGWTARQRR